MQNPSGQVRSATLAVLTALVVSAGAAAQSPLASAVRIDNFAKVNESYFRGAQPVGADYEDLARLGVKTVINLIGDDELDHAEQSSVEEQGMRYVQIPMSTRKAPTARQLETFLSIVNDLAS